AKTLQGQLHAQRVPVTRQRLTGISPKGAAEPRRVATHRAREIADSDVALEISGDRSLRGFDEGGRSIHARLDAGLPRKVRLRLEISAPRPRFLRVLDARIVVRR